MWTVQEAKAKLSEVLERARKGEAHDGRDLVRRGHGDLHLGNIALVDGRPVPFDALEFDPLVASGDLLDLSKHATLAEAQVSK